MNLHPGIEAVLAGDSDGCIIHGDCREVMAEMPAGCVDCVVTDPPYGINIAKNGTIGVAGLVPLTDYGCQEWDAEPPSVETLNRLRIIGRLTILFGANYYSDRLPASKCWIAWNKGIPKGYTKAQVEFAWTNSSTYSRHYHVLWHGMIRDSGEYRYHPTQKPTRLMTLIVQDFTSPGDIILDPFSGSGTTCVAAKKLGRRWIGIEIDEAYCRKARARVRDTEKPLFDPAAVAVGSLTPNLLPLTNPLEAAE